jgi:nucleotide-binding universal stress UspA family protein
VTAHVPCIVHPTDFSDASAAAFAHALRIAVCSQATLYLLHVAGRADEGEWHAFPPVRATLGMWGLLESENVPAAAVGEKLGVRIAKVSIADKDAVSAVVDFIQKNRANLVVLATSGRDGLSHVFHGSRAELISRQSETSTLFISSHGRGFVDERTGQQRLRRILVPVDHEPNPTPALNELTRFVTMLGADLSSLHLLHVGEEAPALYTSPGNTRVPVDLRGGSPVDTILELAQHADMIAMPTAGHHGILDAMRGSTTERIIRHAPCPVLAIPTS